RGGELDRDALLAGRVGRAAVRDAGEGAVPDRDRPADLRRAGIREGEAGARDREAAAARARRDGAAAGRAARAAGVGVADGAAERGQVVVGVLAALERVVLDDDGVRP